MNPKNSSAFVALLLLVMGLLLFCSVGAAQSQDQNQQQDEESLSWYQKLTTDEGVQEQFDKNAILFFGAVFVLGIAVSLTPCVLPMIPITISIISGSRQRVQGQSPVRGVLAGLFSSLVYVLGVSITYALLGVAVALLGGVFRSHLQNWPVQSVMGALFVVLGLSMMGVIPLPLPGWGRATAGKITHRQQAKRSVLTVFALGLLSGIIASPCVAPVVGALLAWISTAGPWLGFWALFVFGWGMGLLLIVMGLTGWVLSSGKWMVKVKAVLGVFLMLMGVWIVVQGLRGEPLIPASWLG